MKRLLAIVILYVLACSPAVWAQDESPEDQYIKTYGLIQRAEQLQAKGRTVDAGAKFLEAQQDLRKLRDNFPEWNPKVVKFRGEYLATKLANLGVKTNAPSSTMIEGPKDPIDLKLKWQVGKRYLQRTEMNQDSEASAAGKTQKQDMKVSSELAISALNEREGGGRNMEMEYVSFALSMKTEGMDLSFDSKKPADQDGANPIAGVFRKLVGAKLKFVTDANGKVESVEGVQELVDRIAGNNSPEAQAMLKDMLGGDNIKQLSAAGLGLPDKPVKTGDSWPVKSEMSLGALGGSMVLNLNYTLKGWEMHDNHKCAVLDFSGDLTSKPTAGDDTPSATAPTFEGGKMSGTTWFDPELGMAIETDGDLNFTLKIAIQGASISTKVHQMLDNKLVQVADIAR